MPPDQPTDTGCPLIVQAVTSEESAEASADSVTIGVTDGVDGAASPDGPDAPDGPVPAPHRLNI